MATTGVRSLMPGEWELQQQQIDRKRKLAEALQQQSMEMPQGQMVSGHYVAANPLQYMAKMLQGYNAKKEMEGYDNEQKTAWETIQNTRKAAGDKLAEAVRGKQVEQPLDYNDTGMPGAIETVTRPSTPQELLQAQLEYGTAIGDQNIVNQALSNAVAQGFKLDDRAYNEGREDKIYSRNRQDKLADTQAGWEHEAAVKKGDQEFQRIMLKEQQGFSLTQQEAQFAQQWKIQQSSQNFQAGQQANSQRFQAGQNALNRADAKRTAASSDWKYDAGSDSWVKPPTPENPNGQRILSPDKRNAAASLDYVIQQFEGERDENGNVKPGTGQLGKTTQGGFMGIAGKVGKVTNYQQSKRFDNLREQLSTELRTLFRIPGEGSLSDKEQAQYGLQLPSVDYDSDTNQKILTDIRNRVSLRQGDGVDKVQLIQRGEKMPAATGRIRYDKNGNRIQ